MTAEVAILRAYAFATQGKYAEAEQLLASAPEALNTPSGADLLARIKFEQGDVATAQRIWEQLLAADPANESAQKALAAIDASPCEVVDDEVLPCFCRRWKFAYISIMVALLGLAFSLGKTWQGSAAPSKNESTISAEAEPQPRIIAEQTLDISKINGKVLSQLRDGILTNMTEKTGLVMSGGRGKYATDRMRSIVVIADCLKDVAGIPLSRMMFRAGDKSEATVTFTVVAD